MKRIKKIVTLIMASVMFLSSLTGMTAKAAGFSPANVYIPAADEAIQDPVLHWAVRSAMNSVDLNGQKLTKEMVASPAVRDISFAQCANPDSFLNNEAWNGKQFWIESLEGLQYATSARMIEISFTNAVEGKRISDLSPLANLTQLEILILKQDGISDISPLRNLVNLEQLDLYENKTITDIDAVAGMKKLKSLKLTNNAITNVDAISNLESLEWLAFNNNKVSDLPDLSKLVNVYFLDAENNCLTNSDVEQIAKMRGLTRLNLLENEDITDYRPLVDLTKLTPETTFLDDAAKKEDLFAAIEVNKLFEYFNISKMRSEDMQNVEDALKAYDNLSEEQKTYMDGNKIKAAKANRDLVASGQEPVYYPEYDSANGVPDFKEIKISVADKYGQPMSGVTFEKRQKSDGSVLQYFTTDEKGRLRITHLPIDNIYDVISIVPAVNSEGNAVYTAEPAEITYTVSWDRNTKTINGKKATGLEEPKVTLIPVNEYVDKTALKETLAKTETVEREYKYTVDSYKTYADAINTAQACLDDPDATETEVTDAVNALNDAIAGLVKSEILTELKVKVVDTNGNTFHRAFELQARVPETDDESWSDYTSPYSGTAYLKASPGWTEGKEWEILAGNDEPYEIEPFRVTIGVKDGQAYFKTVDGEAADVDFEKEVVAAYVSEGAESKTAPDKQIVEEMLASAEEKNLTDYTETAAGNLTKAIDAARVILEKADAIQEDYNAVIAGILKAEEELLEAANKVWLEEELEVAKTYKETYYTKASWDVFKELLADAQEVYDDGDATQEQVDTAVANLKSADENVLVLKADTSVLQEKLAEARAIKSDNYTETSFAALKDAIEKAQEVYDNDESSQAAIDEQVTALDNAVKALVEKPKEANWSCDPTIFRAKVLDTEGNPVAGVKFEVVIANENVDTEITSDKNGVITYYTSIANNGKTTYIKLADERYTTKDEHCFEAGGNQWAVVFTSIDGAAYTNDTVTKLTYTVIPASEHEMVKTEAREATCTKDGNIEYYTCTDCEKVYLDEAGEKEISKEDTVIKSNGHDYKWKVSKKATSSASGYKYGTCSVCGTKTKKTTIYKISTQKLSFTKVVVNGEQQIPEVIIKDSKGKVLVEGVDYTLTPTTGGVEVGRYKMSIKYKGEYSGSKTLYFTVLPKAPASVSAELSTASSTSGYDDVKLTWEKAENASGYRVYYKKATSTKWTYASSTTKGYYTKKNLSDGYEYDFKVVSYYKTKSSSTKYYDADQYAKTSAYTLKKVLKPTVVTNGENVEVNWKEIPGATGYQISQYSSSKKTKIVEPLEISEGKAVLEAPAGKTRYYKVRAYREVNGKKIYAPWSLVKSYKK